MLFAEDQDMIQAVPPERSDQALNVWILAGRRGTNRAGLARAASSRPSGSGHSHAAANGVVPAAGQY